MKQTKKQIQGKTLKEDQQENNHSEDLFADKITSDTIKTINIPDIIDSPRQSDNTVAHAEDTDDNDTDIVMGTEADVTEEDLLLLGERDQDMDMGDDETIDKQGLDDTDFDGDLLNEGPVDLDSTGDDLDIPEADGDNPAKSSLGQGDEENNYYSLGSDDNDNLNEGTS